MFSKLTCKGVAKNIRFKVYLEHDSKVIMLSIRNYFCIIPINYDT